MNGAFKVTVGPLHDVVVTVGLLAGDLFLPANNQNVADHFQVEVAGFQAGHLEHDFDRVTVVGDFCRQQAPARRATDNAFLRRFDVTTRSVGLEACQRITGDVAAEDVVDMEATLYLPDESFDLPADAGDDDYSAPAAYLADERGEPETLVTEAEFRNAASTALRSALPALDPRSCEIIERRWLAEESAATLQELGEHFGVSAERVRQLEAQAISKLRKQIVPLIINNGVGVINISAE